MDKKTAIFQATLNLIAKQGFHGTSMFEIAKKAKVAAGTIYHYFSGKEELINELYLYVLDKLDDRLLTGFDKARRIEDNLRTLWVNWINFYIANPKEFLFLEQYSSSPFVTSFYFEKKDARVVPAVEYMAKAKSEGFFKDLPMEILVGIFYGPIVAIAKDCIAGRLALEEALIEKAFDACLDAIKK